jgi:hypothetical protein
MRAIKPRCLAGCPTSQASRLAVSVSRSKTLNVRVFAHHPNEMTRVDSQRHRSTYHCECPPELEELYHPIEDALEDTKANPERLVILAGIFEYARPDIETLERQRDPENVHEIWQIASLREFAAVKDWMDGGIPAHELDELLADYPNIVGSRPSYKPADISNVDFHWVEHALGSKTDEMIARRAQHSTLA